MMTAGRRARVRSVAIGFVAFVIVMHAVAYFVVGGSATAAPDKHTMIAITATLLLSWLLMVSQAMELMTRAFYARADLDLILASPAAAQKLFAIRIATVALTVAVMALPLAGPFIDMLIWRGGWRWLGAYGVIVAMGAAAAALAVALTVALFRAIGPKRTRLVAQVIAAVIGAAFVIGLQVAAILSYGTLSQATVLRSETVLALAPDIGSVVWWPARAVLGDAGRLPACWLLVSSCSPSPSRWWRRASANMPSPRPAPRMRRQAARSGTRSSARLRRAARSAARNGSCCAAIRGWSRRR